MGVSFQLGNVCLLVTQKDLDVIAPLLLSHHLWERLHCELFHSRTMLYSSHPLVQDRDAGITDKARRVSS